MGTNLPVPAVIQASVPGGSNLGPTPYANASDPDGPPWAVIPVPEHVSTGLWQESYYDPTSTADASVFAKLPSGPCDLQTGRLAGDGFHAGHKFRQT
jgi:hypothetical protein